MRKILFVIPGLHYCGPVRQLTLLAAGLPRPEFEPLVCVLGRDGPMGEELRSAGVAVEVLGWTKLFDLKPFWRLRRLIRTFRPDVIHAWGRKALRAVVPAAGSAGGRLVLSAPFPPQQRRAKTNRLDRSLLRRVHRVAVSGPADAESCRRLGLPDERVVVIPPAVALPAVGAPPAKSGLPETNHRVVGVGPIEPHKGFRDAIWASDILRFLYDDLQLLLVGDGSGADRLKHFVASIGAHWVSFTGPRTEVQSALASGAVVWVPSLAPGGSNVALEAMALGRPVVAARVPGLADVVADGETGYLFPPGDKAALARQTRVLLDDPERRRRFGEAGRQRVGRYFAPSQLVGRFAELYGAVA